MRDYLQTLSLEIDHIQMVQMSPHGKNIGHHVTLFTKDGEALAGGCSSDQQTALRIAVAEAIERSLVFQIGKSSPPAEFFLDSFPTTCGFAAGFESQKTLLRSELEAYERWAWSQWIDRGFFIPGCEIAQEELSPLSRYFFDSFDSIKFYKLSLPTPRGPLTLGISLGLKEGGIFPGSRATYGGENPWGHALLESWRHWISFAHGKKIHKEAGNFVDKRILFFGANARAALSQIPVENTKPWPLPKIAMQRSRKVKGRDIFLCRTLCEDFLGWHEGDHTRFVY